MNTQQWITENGPCQEAKEWLRAFPTMEEAWSACRRAAWMIWAGRRSLSANDPRWRLASCAFVRRTELADGRTVWDLLTDPRSRRAVEVAELHAQGLATAEELRAAAWAARADAVAAARAAAATARSQQADILREFIPNPWAVG